MSSAFVRDGEEMWLRDISPTPEALVYYLTRENGGLPVIEKQNFYSKEYEAQVYKMSNGFSYVVQNNQWVELD